MWIAGTLWIAYRTVSGTRFSKCHRGKTTYCDDGRKPPFRIIIVITHEILRVTDHRLANRSGGGTCREKINSLCEPNSPVLVDDLRAVTVKMILFAIVASKCNVSIGPN
jgi:hypothetical protein